MSASKQACTYLLRLLEALVDLVNACIGMHCHALPENKDPVNV